jgi:hypothetical protein
MEARRALAILPVALLILGQARAAEGFVRYRTDLGPPYAWFQGRVALQGFPVALATMKQDDVLVAMAAAAAAWDFRAPGLLGCSYLELDFSTVERVEAIPGAADDRRNIVVVRTSSWGCEVGAGASATEESLCYDPNALALTTLTTLEKTGEILDADIEVNGVYDVWGDLATQPSPRRQDLQNALTHEMGHFIGLDHPCYLTQAPVPLPVDNTGTPIVRCADAPASVKAATMFPSSTPGDLSLRTLSPDDFAAVCDIYAVAADPHIDTPPINPTGCIFVPAATGSPAIPAALCAIALAARRRRQRP